MATFSIVREERTAILYVSGSFDLHDGTEVEDAIDRIAALDVGALVVDLGRAEFLDSAALGLLNRMRQRLSPKVGRIAIRDIPPHVRRILEVFEFDRVFALS